MDKTKTVPLVVCLQMMHSKPQLRSRIQFKYLSEKLLLFHKLCYLQREPFNNVLHYQPLPITRYQVRFYANNYYE